MDASVIPGHDRYHQVELASFPYFSQMVKMERSFGRVIEKGERTGVKMGVNKV